MDILHKCQGDKFISMVSYPTPNPPPKNLIIPRTIFSFLSFMITNFIKSKMRGIGTKFVFGTTLIHNEVGEAVYVDFLEEALAQGTYIAAPDAKVVGEGLESLQGALDLQKKGVSASKLIVSL